MYLFFTHFQTIVYPKIAGKVIKKVAKKIYNSVEGILTDLVRIKSPPAQLGKVQRPEPKESSCMEIGGRAGCIMSYPYSVYCTLNTRIQCTVH